MKFLIDAQLPRRILRHFHAAGHDAIHTLDLPNANRTSDVEIREIAEREGRVIVSKDRDFVNAFWIFGGSWKLLFVATGNIPNRELDTLLQAKLPLIISILTWAHFVEFSSSKIVVHA